MPKFLRACPEPFRGEVLEVGAGSGWTSRRILETFPQVELTAVDVRGEADEAFEKPRRLYGQRLKFKQADLMSLPFDRETFDMVLAIHTLHYVEDVPEAIRQLLRVTRPGGLIGLAGENMFYRRGIRGWLMKSASVPTKESLEKTLRLEECEVITSDGEVHYFIWARKPYPIGPPKN